MARPLRIEYAGAMYHVMSRGSGRRRIVRDDADRRRRLDWLERTVRMHGWALHAFVLMDNQEHLFLHTPRPNLSAGMQLLNGCYTSYFNLRHRRAGHLFQGRFKAQLIEDEGHYLEVSRYLHLNPCRAGMVDEPQQWQWSSYGGYHDARRALDWVTYDRVLHEFAVGAMDSGERSAARRAYRRFVRAGMTEAIDSPFDRAVGGLILGSEMFVKRIRRKLSEGKPVRARPQMKPLLRRPTLPAIVAATAEVFRMDKRMLTTRPRADDASRAVAAHVARERCGHRAGEVTSALGYRSRGGVPSALRRYHANRARLAPLADRVEKKATND